MGRSWKMSNEIIVSPLGKTWILDLDGTVVKHNGYKMDGYDTLLPGALEFFRSLSTDDRVVFITSRTPAQAEQTERFLRAQGILYHAIVYGVPFGERILVNDSKPSGLRTAIAIETERNRFMETHFVIDNTL